MTKSMRCARLALAVLTAAVVLNPVRVPAAPADVTLTLTQLSSGLTSPVAIAYPPPSGRAMLVEQRGVIKSRSSTGSITTWLDIRDRVHQGGGERGLLGLAFPSNFATTGYFFVYYTTTSGSNRVSRFRASPPSAAIVSRSTEYIIITMAHPTYSNHNGGQLQFAPDGTLYIATGDGGSAGDPRGNAQNLRSLLGKILRLDVGRACGSLHYCNPRSNPYFYSSTAMHEIWDFGLRNPWRFSFDRLNGYLFIADVGQNASEEIDWTNNSRGGLNWGWDCYEGLINTVSTYGGSYCSGRTFVRPVHTYGHSSGRCAIIGGYRYRGSASPVMAGMYIFADYCTGEIWLMGYTPNGWIVSRRVDHPYNVASFGEDRSGELFMVDASGRYWRITAS